MVMERMVVTWFIIIVEGGLSGLQEADGDGLFSLKRYALALSLELQGKDVNAGSGAALRTTMGISLRAFIVSSLTIFIYRMYCTGCCFIFLCQEWSNKIYRKSLACCIECHQMGSVVRRQYLVEVQYDSSRGDLIM